MAVEGPHQQLRHRLLLSIRFVQHFLDWFGIYLVRSGGIKTNHSVLRLIWSFFWLFLNVESSIYVFLNKGVPSILKTIYWTSNKLMTMNFNNSLIRIAAFLFEMPIHFFFLILLIYRSNFQHFIETLEPVDSQLGRPNLTTIQYYSIASLICTAWTVYSLFYKKFYNNDTI